MHVIEWQPELFLVDDYAHHPTEIQAVYDTLQERYPKMEKTVVFQPHLYSRTKDFFEDFAKVLALFDRVFVFNWYACVCICLFYIYVCVCVCLIMRVCV